MPTFDELDTFTEFMTAIFYYIVVYSLVDRLCAAYERRSKT